MPSTGFSNGTVCADNVCFNGTRTPEVNADGQLIIGATVAPNLRIGTLTSTDASVTVTPGAGTINLATAATSKITKYTSNDIWVKDARTRSVELWVFGGGGGGASGRRGASTASTGGLGGSSGGGFIGNCPASFFGANEVVTIGATATGGAAQTVDNTNGNAGADGNLSSFGTFIVATGGTAAFGRGSGTVDGSDGGTGSTGDGADAVDAYYAIVISTGGGGGAGADSVTERPGGDGGVFYANLAAPPSFILYAASAGGIESGTINGAVGSSVASPSHFFPTGGSGGGGGGGQSVGAVAGNGGNGGTPCGGGGGGGGSLNGTNSGTGGDGARGEIWVIEHF